MNKKNIPENWLICRNINEWHNWLMSNHNTESEVWLQIRKVKSNEAGIILSEAVEEALIAAG